MEKFENFDGVPADAQQVLRVRQSPHSGIALAEVVAFGSERVDTVYVRMNAERFEGSLTICDRRGIWTREA